jgi:hypothetical protein
MATKESPPLDTYFHSQDSMLIFALLYLDGDVRAKLLGINEALYESEKKAKNWRAKIVKKIHPDYCKHPRADDATSKLNAIYARMIQHAE